MGHETEVGNIVVPWEVVENDEEARVGDLDDESEHNSRPSDVYKMVGALVCLKVVILP